MCLGLQLGEVLRLRMKNYELFIYSLLVFVGIFDMYVLSLKSERAYRRKFDYSEEEAQTPRETILSTSIGSEMICAVLCGQTVNCIAFLFNSKSKICRLLNGLQNVRISDVSNERRSYFEMFIDCPLDWEKHSMKCYRFFTEKRHMAKEHCESIDAHLVEIENAEENDWIFEQMKYYESKGEEWWSGGSDTGSEGTWYWQHSHSNMTFLAWNLDEPNGGTIENCVLLKLNHHWVDCSCWYRASNYICEK